MSELLLRYFPRVSDEGAVEGEGSRTWKQNEVMMEKAGPGGEEGQEGEEGVIGRDAVIR